MAHTLRTKGLNQRTMTHCARLSLTCGVSTWSKVPKALCRYNLPTQRGQRQQQEEAATAAR